MANDQTGKDEQRVTVFINKPGAAQRQLDAAIRMTFAREDELAIHTVAAAAYRILREMLKGRNRDDYFELVIAGINAKALSMAKGDMPESELSDLVDNHSELYKMICKISEDFRTNGNSNGYDVIHEGPVRHVNWDKIFETANFLKHGDRDEGRLLSLNDVDNETIISRGCAAYRMVAPNMPTTPEMDVFNFNFIAVHGLHSRLEDPGLSALADRLQGMTPLQRLRSCRTLIKDIKKERRQRLKDRELLTPTAARLRRDEQCRDIAPASREQRKSGTTQS